MENNFPTAFDKRKNLYKQIVERDTETDWGTEDQFMGGLDNDTDRKMIFDTMKENGLLHPDYDYEKFQNRLGYGFINLPEDSQTGNEPLTYPSAQTPFQKVPEAPKYEQTSTPVEYKPEEPQKAVAPFTPEATEEMGYNSEQTKQLNEQLRAKYMPQQTAAGMAEQVQRGVQQTQQQFNAGADMLRQQAEKGDAVSLEQHRQNSLQQQAARVHAQAAAQYVYKRIVAPILNEVPEGKENVPELKKSKFLTDPGKKFTDMNDAITPEVLDMYTRNAYGRDFQTYDKYERAMIKTELSNLMTGELLEEMADRHEPQHILDYYMRKVKASGMGTSSQAVIDNLTGNEASRYRQMVEESALAKYEKNNLNTFVGHLITGAAKGDAMFFDMMLLNKVMNGGLVGWLQKNPLVASSKFMAPGARSATMAARDALLNNPYTNGLIQGSASIAAQYMAFGRLDVINKGMNILSDPDFGKRYGNLRGEGFWQAIGCPTWNIINELADAYNEGGKTGAQLAMIGGISNGVTNLFERSAYRTASKIAGFAGEVGFFTKQGIDAHNEMFPNDQIGITDYDRWGEEFLEQTGLIGAMKIGGGLEHQASKRPSRMELLKKRVAGADKLLKDNGLGMTIDDWDAIASIGLGKHSSIDADLASRLFVPAENGEGLVYDDIMHNKKLPLSTMYKLKVAMEHKVSTMGFTMDTNGDVVASLDPADFIQANVWVPRKNGFTVTSFGMHDEVVDRKTFRSREDAEKYKEVMDKRAQLNTIRVMEAQLGDTRTTVIDAINRWADQTGMGRADAIELYNDWLDNREDAMPQSIEMAKEVDADIWNQVSNDRAFAINNLRRMIAEQTGVDISTVMGKPLDTFTMEEIDALQKYSNAIRETKRRSVTDPDILLVEDRMDDNGVIRTAETIDKRTVFIKSEKNGTAIIVDENGKPGMMDMKELKVVSEERSEDVLKALREARADQEKQAQKPEAKQEPAKEEPKEEPKAENKEAEAEPKPEPKPEQAPEPIAEEEKVEEKGKPVKAYDAQNDVEYIGEDLGAGNKVGTHRVRLENGQVVEFPVEDITAMEQAAAPEPVAEAPVPEVEKPAPAVTDNGNGIKVDERGIPTMDNEAASTAKWFAEDPEGLGTDITKGMLENITKKVNADLEASMKRKPNMGDMNVARIKAEKQAIEADIAAKQQVADYWNAVNEEVRKMDNVRKMKEDTEKYLASREDKPLRKRVDKAVAEIGDPSTIREAVLMQYLSPNGFGIAREDFIRELGAAGEKLIKEGFGNQTAPKGLGVTIQALAESIASNHDTWEVQDVRNEIISVLDEYGGKKSNAIAELERMADAHAGRIKEMSDEEAARMQEHYKAEGMDMNAPIDGLEKAPEELAPSETPVPFSIEPEESTVKPIGSGPFGKIYDHFVGKAKEALAFLMSKESGDLRSVFHRDGFGDVDLVWGDSNGGLKHILDKHVGKGKSFATPEEAIEEIDNIIKNGEMIDKDYPEKMVFRIGDKLVVLKLKVRDGGKLKAAKNWVLTAYDEKSADGTRAISSSIQGQAAPATDDSAGKGSEKYSIGEEKSPVNQLSGNNNESNNGFANTGEQNQWNGKLKQVRSRMDYMNLREEVLKDDSLSMDQKAERLADTNHRWMEIVAEDYRNASKATGVSIDVLQKMEKASGVRVVSDASMFSSKRENAKYDRQNNTIYINPEAIGIDNLTGVLCHELMHSLEKAGKYESVAKELLAIQFGSDEELDKAIKDLMKRYNDHFRNMREAGKKAPEDLTYEDAKKEVVADVLKETLFKGEKGVKRFDAAIGRMENKDLASRTAAKLRDAYDLLVTACKEGTQSALKEKAMMDARNHFADLAIEKKLELEKTYGENQIQLSFENVPDYEEPASEDFNKWFDKSKVVDKDGDPKVMYHETNADFAVFDTKKSVHGSTDYTTPFGIFVKPTNKSIGLGHIQMPLYVNISNPLEVRNRAELDRFLGDNISGYKQANQWLVETDKQIADIYGEIEKLMDLPESDEVNAAIDAKEKEAQQLDESYKNAARLLKKDVTDFFRGSQYDGIHLVSDDGSWGRSVESWIALDASQVKSAVKDEGDNMSIAINSKKFDKDLNKQIEGKLSEGHVYKIGMPSPILRSAGIPNLPIELVASRLVDKSMQENHPFDLREVIGLVEAIQKPLAVFRSATHIGSNVILTNIKHGEKDFVVAIETNRKVGRNYINSIRSVHYRNALNIINWVNEGLADYISETFKNDWFEEKKNELRSKPQYNSADVRKQLISAAKILKTFENPIIKAEKNANSIELGRDWNSNNAISDQSRMQFSIEDAPEVEAEKSVENGDAVQYSLVTEDNATPKDKDIIREIAEGKTEKVYRGMQVVEIDGKKYALPPMASKINGEYVHGILIHDDGTLEPELLKSDEHPELAKDGKFYLDKGNGKGLKAAYNPYWHVGKGMLNDQFAEAQDRANLITVEGVIPTSELTDGYHAEKAKDGVGAHEWKAGIVQGQLSGTREVILSRYFQGMRVVPDKEVASNIYGQINGKVDVMPTNVVPPAVRAELEKMGVKFIETNNNNELQEGEHAGDRYTWWYGKNAESNRAKAFNKQAKAAGMKLSDWMKENNREGQLPESVVSKSDARSQFSIEDDERYLNYLDVKKKEIERFNNELSEFKSNKHNGLLHLGTPGAKLKACGINAQELTLAPKILKSHLRKHNLTEDDLVDLAESIQDPILVYKHGLKKPNIVVVTEKLVKGGKLSISVELDENGNVVDIDNVRSVHQKEAQLELQRLSEMGEEDLKNGLRWVEKEKVLDWLFGVGLYRRMPENASSELLSVAKILRNFENPRIEPEKNANSTELGRNWNSNNAISDQSRMPFSIEDAPEAEPIDSKNFKNWFGDWKEDPKNASKVVDEDGKPKVVYHWSRPGITWFDRSKARKSMDVEGFFFQGDPESSREYGDTMYSVYLNMKNPFIVDSYEKMKMASPDMSKTGDGVRVREELEAKGYDGIINKAEYMGTESDEYVVFNPEQIKSVRNNGGFNPEDRRFDYSIEGGEDAEDMAEGTSSDFDGQIYDSAKHVKLTEKDYGADMYRISSSYNKDFSKAMDAVHRGVEYMQNGIRNTHFGDETHEMPAFNIDPNTMLGKTSWGDDVTAHDMYVKQRDELRPVVNNWLKTLDYLKNNSNSKYVKDALDWDIKSANELLHNLEAAAKPDYNPYTDLQFSIQEDDVDVADAKEIDKVIVKNYDFSKDALPIGKNYVSLPDKRQSENLPSTAKWGDDTAVVYNHTSTANLKGRFNPKLKDLHTKAKQGDSASAIELVNATIKQSVIDELKQKHPNAIIVYPHAEEMAGKNKIPAAIATVFEKNGFAVNDNLYQINRTFHTSKAGPERVVSRARFDGELEPGKEYIIVDDVFTSGSTIRDMKDYVESKGGKVVAVSTLSVGKLGKQLRVDNDVIDKLIKSGVTNEQLKNAGIADNLEGLTQYEANIILSLANKGRNKQSQGGQYAGQKGNEANAGDGVSYSLEDEDHAMDTEPGTQEVADDSWTSYRDLLDDMSKEAANMQRELEWIKNGGTDKGLATRVRYFIRNRLNAKAGTGLTAAGVNDLLKQLDEVEDINGIDPILKRIQQTLNKAELKAEMDEMLKILNTRTQSQTKQGLVTGIGVDAQTNQIMNDIRGSFRQMITTDVDEKIKMVNRQIRDLKAEYGIQRVEDGNLEFQQRYTQLRNEMADLKNERADAQRTNAENEIEAITDREESILNEMNDLREQGKEIPITLIEEKIALPIRKAFGELAYMQKELERTDKELSEAYNMPGRTKAERTERNAAIDEKQRDLLNWQRRCVLQSRHIAADLHDLITEGKSKRAEIVKKQIKDDSELIVAALVAVNDQKIEQRNDRIGVVEHLDKEWTPQEKMMASLKEGFDEINKNDFANWWNKPCYSFNFLLKTIDRNHTSENSHLYDMLMRSEHGAVEANDAYSENMRDYGNRLNEKTEELFGMSYDDLLADSRKRTWKTILVEGRDPDSGEMFSDYKEFTKGQALYTWLTWRQLGGQQKLRKEGYTEKTIQQLEEVMGPKYVELGKWITEDFLPELRAIRYNPTYERLYGTSMHMTSHYFPIKIWDKAIHDKGEIGQGVNDTPLPSSAASNLVMRKESTLPIDTDQNALEILIDYGKKMERWNAMSDLTRQLNVLKHCNAFRNRIIANHGEKMWDQWLQACEVVTNSYNSTKGGSTPEIFYGKLQNAFLKGAIGFRWYTALKQTLSYPAFSSYAMDKGFQTELLANIGRTFTSEKLFGEAMQSNFEWAMKNLPGFRQRVQDNDMGIENLSEEGFFGKTGKLISDWGMAANKWVDARTVAAGARAVYNYEYKKGIEQGLGEAEAKRRAKVNAEICFNESQQSSRPEFASPMQKDRDLVSRSFVAFQNSNISYRRAVLEGVGDIFRAYREHEDGRMNKEDRNKAIIKAMYKVVNFGAILPGLWAAGGSIGWLWSNNQKDEDDDKVLTNVLLNIGMGMLSNGSSMGTMVTTGENILYNVLTDDEYSAKAGDMNPFQSANLLGDIVEESVNIWKQYKKDQKEEGGQAVSMLAQSLGSYGLKLVGINPETFANMAVGLTDLAKRGKLELQDAMFVLNVPGSQRKKIVERMARKDSAAEFMRQMEEVSKAYEEGDLRIHPLVQGTRVLSDQKRSELLQLYINAKDPVIAETMKQVSDISKKVSEAKSEYDGKLTPEGLQYPDALKKAEAIADVFAEGEDLGISETAYKKLAHTYITDKDGMYVLHHDKDGRPKAETLLQKYSRVHKECMEASKEIQKNPELLNQKVDELLDICRQIQETAKQ